MVKKNATALFSIMVQNTSLSITKRIQIILKDTPFSPSNDLKTFSCQFQSVKTIIKAQAQPISYRL